MRCLRIIVVVMSLFIGRAAMAADHGPHGGALVPFKVLGQTKANMEFVLDYKSGKMTAYVLDYHAKAPLSLNQNKIELIVYALKPTSGQADEITLKPVSTNENGEASVYSAPAPLLTTMTVFNVQIKRVVIEGEVFEDISFVYPEGD